MQEENKLIRCPKCQNPVYSNWQFCINCGTPINIKTTTETENETDYDIPDFLKSIFKGRV